MKKVLVAFVVVILVAGGALLALPSFWDWNGEKGRMAALVKEHTGRDLEIAGDVSLRLLPAPAFAARGVTLANIEGGSDAAMVQLEELQVRVALMPLLRGTVRVESVTLVQPEVLLEVLPDGRANWQFDTAPAPQVPGAESPGVSLDTAEAATGQDSIRVDSFIIVNGRVRYRDALRGHEEVVNDFNAELGAESLIGPFVASGAATYQGVPLEFDFNLDRLVENGATALSLSLGLPQARASGQFLGALSRHEDLRTLRGRIQAKGDDLAALIEGLPLAEAPDGLPSLLAQPFDLSAEVAGSESEAAANAIALNLGPLSLGGAAALRFGEAPDVTVDLATKTIDLDKLLAAPAAEPPRTSESGRNANTDRPAPVAAPETGETTLPALPRGISASLTLAADALLYRGQTVRQFQAAARLENGELSLEKAAAQLPGSSDASLVGTVSTTAQGPRFNGSIEADSDNLRALLQWLDVEIPAVPADRLRRMAMKTGIEVQQDQVTLRNIDLQLDVSRLTGGIAIALRDRPGLGIGVTLDRLNLDAYMPAPSNAGAAQPAEQVDSSAGAGGTAQPQPAPAAAAAAPSGLAVLGDFDANIDVKVGQLTYQGLPLNGLRLDATLQRGGLVVREFSVDDLAGSRGRFAGSLANVDRDPSVDGSIEISVAALSRLTKLLDLADVGQLPLESFTLSGAINGNREEVRFDQRLVALNGSLKAAGRAAMKPDAPAVEAALRIEHPDLSVLLGEFTRDGSVPAGLGAIALEGRLAATPAMVALSGLQGEVAGVKLLAGDLDVALAGPRPKITAELTTGSLPLAALGAPAAAGKSSAKKGNGAGTGSAKRPAGRERWSSKPIDVSALRAVDADVKLHAAEILAGKLRLAKAEVEAALVGGVLDLKRFDAATYGGTVSVTGRADARETARDGLEIETALTATDIQMKDLLRDLADTDRFSGPLSLQSDLSSHGLSEAALVSTLNGRGNLGGTLTVAAKVEEQGAALVLNLLGRKVKEVRGITDSTTMLFSSFAGAPSKVDGTFVVEQGVLRSDDLKVRGRDAVAMTAGNANLPTWRLESRTDVFRDSDLNTAYLTAVLRGPLDTPDVGFSGQSFQRREEAAPTAVEIPDTVPQPLQEQKQEQPARPDPEELLREGVKSLLKGLGG